MYYQREACGYSQIEPSFPRNIGIVVGRHDLSVRSLDGVQRAPCRVPGKGPSLSGGPPSHPPSHSRQKMFPEEDQPAHGYELQQTLPSP